MSVAHRKKNLAKHGYYFRIHMIHNVKPVA
jgi:hypothetical protein